MTLAALPRLAALALGLSLLAACNRDDLAEPPVDLGDFRLGLNIVVADNMQKVPISRDATVEEWETGLKKAIDDRFGRYDGNRFYNIGIAVDGYALAPPGIPVVAAPKSVIVVTANIWDDASQTRLNGEPEQFTIFENLDPNSVIGSGLTKTKRQQIDALSFNVAKALERWFVDNPQWFADSGAVPDARPDGTQPPTGAPSVAVTPAATTEVTTTALPAATTTATTATTSPATSAPPRRPATLVTTP
jgi:hypothetical protein